MLSWQWLRNRLIALFWRIDTPTLLLVDIAPAMCLQVIKTASKPSITRLHHRNLFADGRRYHLEPTADGFIMTTTSKIWWKYRSRTSHSAVMQGTFTPFGDDRFSLRLETHIRLFYLLDIFLLPAFMTSLLIYTPWHGAVIIALSLILLGLSWSAHRFNVALEANEMVWFIRTAMDEHLVEMSILGGESPTVLTIDPEFEREWERFFKTSAHPRPNDDDAD